MVGVICCAPGVSCRAPDMIYCACGRVCDGDGEETLSVKEQAIRRHAVFIRQDSDITGQ